MGWNGYCCIVFSISFLMDSSFIWWTLVGFDSIGLESNHYVFIIIQTVGSNQKFLRCIESRYCWWKKSCTTWDVWNSINNGINYLSTGAGFQPSTVSCSCLFAFVLDDEWFYSKMFQQLLENQYFTFFTHNIHIDKSMIAVYHDMFVNT